MVEVVWSVVECEEICMEGVCGGVCGGCVHGHVYMEDVCVCNEGEMCLHVCTQKQ